MAQEGRLDKVRWIWWGKVPHLTIGEDKAIA